MNDEKEEEEDEEERREDRKTKEEEEEITWIPRFACQSGARARGKTDSQRE